jgi:phospholipase/carboxylesterase
MSADTADLGFIHICIPATRPGRPPLLLLHGSGGDESDLIPLGKHLVPGAPLLSPRGKVVESGVTRFFRRVAEGVFDLDDLKARTLELDAFIGAARNAYGLEKPFVVGFSNGANIAASLLMTKPQALAGAVLIRAMLPFEPDPMPELNGTPVLLLSGAADPIVPAAKRDRLAAVLAESGAAVRHDVVAAGHNLTHRDLGLARDWLENLQ